jgi:3-hydroxyisobutyrate dehydrogenase-like beta-hydroxyacid dehydrogenase
MAHSFEFNKLGFIGLGAMGKPMVTHLAKKLPSGSRIWVFDVVEQAMDELCAEFPDRVFKGVNAKAVTQEVVRRQGVASYKANRYQDTIITMVPEGSHVRSVYLDPEMGVCSTDVSNKLIIDCSTIDTVRLSRYEVGAVSTIELDLHFGRS